MVSDKWSQTNGPNKWSQANSFEQMVSNECSQTIGLKPIPSTKWSQPNGLNNWSQTTGLEQMISSECSQIVDLEQLVSNKWSQTYSLKPKVSKCVLNKLSQTNAFKQKVSNECSQTGTLKQVLWNKWPPTNSLKQIVKTNGLKQMVSNKQSHHQMVSNKTLVLCAVLMSCRRSGLPRGALGFGGLRVGRCGRYRRMAFALVTLGQSSCYIKAEVSSM